MDIATLLERLRTLFTYKTKYIQSNFHRTLPFGELIVDRWEKARLLGFGEEASIYDSALVFGDVHVGAHSWVGPHVILDGSAAPIRIGSWCSISSGTHIYTHDSVGWAVTGGKMSYASGKIFIGSRVYIGPLCIITKGITIGDESIIGAHSFVNSDIPPNSFAWGQPARVRGEVIVNDTKTEYFIKYT